MCSKLDVDDYEQVQSITMPCASVLVDDRKVEDLGEGGGGPERRKVGIVFRIY